MTYEDDDIEDLMPCISPNPKEDQDADDRSFQAYQQLAALL